MEMDDRSDSDEVRLKKEPKSVEEESEKEEEEVQQEEKKLKDDPESTSLTEARPEATPTPASDAAVPAGPQLTIFYGGIVKVFDGISEDKVIEIVHIAAEAAIATKTSDVKNMEADNASSAPPQQKLPSSVAVVSSLLGLCPSPRSSMCKVQAEFPIARRQSLQRFLEKRRDRLVSKNPYPSSPAMKVESDMKI